MPPPSPEDDLDAYASLAAALAAPGADREAILGARGLDEEGWEAIEEAWLDRLDAASEADGDRDGIPPLVAAHAEAMARAQAERGKSALLPFDRFAAVARALAHGEDAPSALARLGVSFEAYLAAQRHWTARAIEDEALAAELEKALG